MPVLDRELLTQNTIKRYFQVWMDNFRQNLPYMWIEPDISQLPRGEGKPAVVIGAGPSLTKYGHLSLLAKSKFNGGVFVCDRVFKEATSKNVKVNYVVNADASPLTAEFVKVPTLSATLLLTSIASPETRDSWIGKRYWFVDDINSGGFVTPADSLALIARKTLISTGGNVGCGCMVLANELGYAPIALIGMDMSYSVDEPIEHTPYWAALVSELGETEARKAFVRGMNPHWGNEYVTDYVFRLYKDEIMQRIRHFHVSAINCSGQGALGEMCCQNFALFLKEHS